MSCDSITSQSGGGVSFGITRQAGSESIAKGKTASASIAVIHSA